MNKAIDNLRALTKEQFDALVGLDYHQQAGVVLGHMLGEHVADMCEHAYGDWQPSLLQVDDGLYIYELDDWHTGSVHDVAVAFYLQYTKGAAKLNTLCPDIAAALAALTSQQIYYAHDGGLSSMQHLQLLTRPNVDITLVDGDWQAATQGVTDVPEHNAFMYAHVVWYVSLYVGMMDRVDRLTVYVPRYSGICQRAAQIAIELGVPMDVIVADKLECQDVSKHIHELYDEYGIVASPDLAQSYAGYKSAPTPSVLLATRSPYKFVDTVLQALKLPKSVHMHLNLSKLSNYTALAPHEEFVRASSAARRASARKAT